MKRILSTTRRFCFAVVKFKVIAIQKPLHVVKHFKQRLLFRWINIPSISKEMQLSMFASS